MSVLILGANSDIAKACARQWAASGEELHLALRKPTVLDNHVEALLQQGVEVHLHQFDAVDPASRASLLSSIDPFPEVTLCVFGYLGDEEKAMSDAEERQVILNTNFNAAVEILAPIAEKYKANGKGVIAGISSVAGDRGKGRTLHYGAAKAGFTNYLDGLRNALHGTGVHVFTIKPGFVRTRMTAGMDTPGPLTAAPEQVAKAIIKGIRKRKNNLYTKPIWRFVMWVIRSIPEPIFKKRQW